MADPMLKCERCGDVRRTYEPGGCSGEKAWRETDQFKAMAAGGGAWEATRFFEKHLCHPREMTVDEVIEYFESEVARLQEKIDYANDVAFERDLLD